VVAKDSQINSPRRTNFGKRNAYEILAEEYNGKSLNGRAILLLATDVQCLILNSYTHTHTHIYIYIYIYIYILTKVYTCQNV